MTDNKSASLTPLIPALRPLTDALSPFAEPMIRIVTGLLLMPHGAQKLFGWFGGRGVDETGVYFVTVYSLPPMLATTAGIIEFVGGGMLVAGFATRLAALCVAGMMAFIVTDVHWHNGFFWIDGGFEYPLLWGVLGLYFAIKGGGRFSVDHALGAEL
jgi:putative oxidoreductase